MIDYVELHTHSYFSLLDGASSPEALVERAAALEMHSLALTDHDALYGAVPFVESAREHGIRPILGAELTLADDSHLSLLVENEAGWRNLCGLITQARQQATKGEARLPLDTLDGQTAGLIALSGCRRGAVASALLHGDEAAAFKIARRWLALFGRDHCFIELQHHLLPDDNALVAALVELADRLGVEIVATNNVHYAERSGHARQDVLVSVHQRLPLDENPHLRPNSEYYLKSPQQMARLFRDYPAALANTCHIAERCRFDLHYGLQELPAFPTPDERDPVTYLHDLCLEGLRRRFGALSERACQQLEHELGVIARAGLANYFLIVWDVVRFARAQGILCQGRGSAANSLVAYTLDISPVDPLAHDLLFERFLSDERPFVPDIDLDFQADRREEVIQYVYRRYGAAHAAMACTFVTFRTRSALRDVGFALGLPPTVVEQTLQALDLDDPPRDDPATAQLLDLARQIDGFPRHLGIHNGGMVITSAPITARLPTEPATMADRVVVQWDKDGLERAGLVKIDLLGLRMLSVVAEAKAAIEAQIGQSLDLEALMPTDPTVYASITDADTIGVFQVESRAQMSVLPRLKPNQFSDLIVSISLIRPGPVQGNMVHPYLRRRFGAEAVTYPHPLVEPALKETLGVLLFQEQVLKVARDLAGFSPGQGEVLRRALGSKRAVEQIDRLHDDFLSGAQKRNVPANVAEHVFAALRAFGGYSFPKSHAAAFAVLVYRSAWIKYHFPQAYLMALLNQQPLGFWSPAVIVNDAKRRGIPVLPVDLHRSGGRCTVENESIRLGFNYVKGFGDAQIDRLLAAREQRPFANLADLWRRAQLPKRLIEHLILAGALDGWGLRRDLLWALGKLRGGAEELDLAYPDDGVQFAPLTVEEAMQLEHEVLGLSLRDHLMTLYRDSLTPQHVLTSADLLHRADGQPAQTAGLVVVHQSPPTAKGVHFLTLEDETGLIDVIVRPDVYRQYRRLIRGRALLRFAGRVQAKDGVVSLLASTVQPLKASHS